jgi:hypothetical protein
MNELMALIVLFIAMLATFAIDIWQQRRQTSPKRKEDLYAYSRNQ